LKSQGIKKVFLNGIGNQKGEFSELKTYIISKLLWDVNADVEKLKVEFCNAFYGSAAKDVLDYIQALESTAKKTNAIVDVWANPILNKNDFLSQKNINLYKSILNKGLLKVKENPVLYSRVLKEYASLQYAEIEIASQDNNRLQELGGQNELQKKIILLQDHLKSTKVHFLRNGEQSIEDYKKSKEK